MAHKHFFLQTQSAKKLGVNLPQCLQISTAQKGRLS
jgi:hypothetical protein